MAWVSVRKAPVLRVRGILARAGERARVSLEEATSMHWEESWYAVVRAAGDVAKF